MPRFGCFLMDTWVVDLGQPEVVPVPGCYGRGVVKLRCTQGTRWIIAFIIGGSFTASNELWNSTARTPNLTSER
jgi:hypothetical protein